MLNLFQHLFIYEIPKQVRDDNVKQYVRECRRNKK